jgi:uncharacterized membrane protein
MSFVWWIINEKYVHKIQSCCTFHNLFSLFNNCIQLTAVLTSKWQHFHRLLQSVPVPLILTTDLSECQTCRIHAFVEFRNLALLHWQYEILMQVIIIKTSYIMRFVRTLTFYFYRFWVCIYVNVSTWLFALLLDSLYATMRGQDFTFHNYSLNSAHLLVSK